MYKIYTNNWDIPDGYLYKIWLIMRLTTVILIATIMQVGAAGFAQKISMVKSKAPLKTVLKELKSQSGYIFLYTESVLKLAKPVDIKVNNADFQDVLELIFENQPLSYTINESTITVKEKAPSLLDKFNSVISNIVRDLVVKGKVTDQDGKPLPNASIRVKGKSAVTNTNSEGEFELKGVDEDAVLLVSYVGFKTLEIAVKDAVMPLEIKLNVATGELEEVKVVYNTGYQELNKERSTGSFVQIDNELFNRAVGTNVLDRILNVTSGLIFNPIPGGTGASKNNIVVRGFSTINASKDALVVIDNFPYEGELNTLNPNDVESVTVLKDAAAASIWGVRAGNGVIVITTKRGKFNQPTNIGFNSNVTIGEKPNLFYIPYMSSKDIVDFEKLQFGKGVYNDYDDLYPSFGAFPVLPQAIETLLAARKKNKTVPGYSATNDPVVSVVLDDLANHDIRDDIDKYLLQNSINQQYSLNLSGSGDSFNYYASVGYDQNRTNNIASQNNRLSLNFNNNWRPIKNLEISSNIVHSRGNNNNSGNIYNNFLPKPEISPYTKLATEQGNPIPIPKLYRTAYVDTARSPALLDWHYSPLEDSKYIDNTNQSYDTRLSAILSYSIRSWLKVEFQYQNQNTQSNFRNYKGQQSFEVRNNINSFMGRDASGKIVYPYPLGDVVDFNNVTFKAWNARGSLRFNQRFKNHQVSAFVGIELRESSTESNNNTLYGYDSNTFLSVPVSYTQSFPTRPLNTGIVGLLRQSTGNLTRNGSFFVNAEYNYKGKYLATGSGRMDQSNFFGVKANLRRVPLWSAGFAWNLHLEDFYHIDWLSVLKLKTSYGYTGNTNSGASSYATFRYLQGSSANNDGAPPRNISFGEVRTPNNPELRWERVKQINAGVEFALRDNRVLGSIEIYYKKGLDLLAPITTNLTTGFASYTGNQASIKARGMDFNLNTRNLMRKTFEWTTNLNISFNQDKITAYKGIPLTPNNLALSSQVNIGDPLYTLYSFRYAGLSPINGEPRLYLADTISSFGNYTKALKSDLIFHGQKNPKVFGSFINTFSYKQISLSANFTYRLGYYFRRNSIDYNNLLASGWSGHSDYVLRWKKPGDETLTNIPSLPVSSNSARNTVYLNSDVLVEKGDHIRFQDIRIDYRLNKDVFKILPFKQISFYMYAANLGIIWRANEKGLDPDAYSFGSLPASKTIAFGLNANF